MKKKIAPSKTRDRIVIVILAALFLFACFACSPMKKDCRGVWHEKQKGGFYL